MGNRKHRKPPQAAPEVKKEGRIDGARRLVFGAMGKSESIAISAAKAVGFSRAENWFSCFFHPENSIDGGKTGHSLLRVLTDLTIFYIIYAVVSFLTLGYTIYYSGVGNPVAFPENHIVPDPAIFAAGMLVLSPLFNILAWFVVAAIVFALAKLLGGTSDFALHAGALSRIFCGSSSILTIWYIFLFGLGAVGVRFLGGYSISGMIMMMIGFVVMIIAAVIALAIWIYSLYGYFVALKTAHRISGWKVAGIMLLVLLVLVLLIFFV